jgi:hypothetical protein
MSGVNASIPLQFQPTQFPGFDAGRAVQTASQMMQFQQQQQQQKSQNALRGILAAPGAIDDSGNPTPDAMKQIAAVDPNAAMKLQQNALMMQQQKLRTDVMKTDQFGKKLDLLNDSYGPVMQRYQDAIKGGKTPEQAAALAQTDLDSVNQQLQQGGMFSPQEQQTHPTKFDPMQMQKFFDGSAQVRDWRKSQLQADQESRTQNRADAAQTERERHDRAVEGEGKPAEIEVMVDPTKKDANGNPTPYSYNKVTREATTLDGKPYTPGGVAKVGAEAKPPPPGSIAANRAAIADDVNNDPEFKDGPPGAKAQEVETRLKIAQGTMSSPEQQKDYAAQIAGYQQAPLSGFAAGRPEGQKIMAEVRKINPDYQASRYHEVSTAMTAFGSGKQGDTIRYINNAVQHIGVMSEAADALKNGDMRTFNSLAQTIGKEFGVAAPTTFDGLRQIVGTEIERAATGGVGAAVDRDRIIESLNRANSPQQLADVFDKFKQLFKGQTNSLKNQYEDATGFKTGQFAFDNKLLPETKKALGWSGADDKSGTSKPGDKTTTKGDLPPAKTDEGAIPTFGASQSDLAEIAKLPKGTRFKGADGKIYVTQKEPAGTAPPASAPAPAAPAPTQTPAQQPAATPPAATTPTPSPAGATPPAGGYAVPAAHANDPDGMTYNGGKWVKRGGFIVPGQGASGPPAGGAGDPLAQARAAIASGAPRDAVIKRLRDNGIDPAGL